MTPFPDRIRRTLRVAAASALLLFAAPPPAAALSPLDSEFHDCAFAKGPGNGECQHFLKNPLGATDDPCWCDKCRNGATGEHHDGKTIPSGWSETAFASTNIDVYLKRHAVAWGITCSACYANDKAAWPDAGGAAGPLGTTPKSDYGGQPAQTTLDVRLAAERDFFKKPEDVVLAYDRHFYMVTDIDPLKVRTAAGGERMVSRHEWAHLMIERAELARREWVRNFGEVMSRKPCALFFPEKERDLLRIGAKYFRIPGAKGLRGGGGDLCDGMCLTAVAFSHEKQGGDISLQVGLRHMLARALLSIYAAQPTRPKSLPVWLDEGLAHWLVKTRFPDAAHYDVSEGGGAAQGGGTGGNIRTWPGKDWDKDILGYVRGGKLIVIDELLGKLDFAQMSEEDHKRSWSYCDLCLAEWREPFVRLVRALRQEKELREAFTKSLGCTPGEFDDRWKDRILGRRKSMAAEAREEESEDAPGVRDRAALRSETNPKTLVAKLRGLGEIKDVKTIPVVVDVLAQNNDLLRETAFVALLKTKDKTCLDTLWNYGLGHQDAVVRAYTAKLCGRLKLATALPRLEALLDDKFWLARSEAAVACGLLADAKAMPTLRKMIDGDPSDKAQVGAIDAVAMDREDPESSIPVLAKRLDSAQWQLRVAAAQALGETGLMEAVEPLIARMEKETGRISDEIRLALKKITRDDLGPRASSWRKWWEAEKANSPNGLPKRPEAPKKKNGPDPDDPHSTSGAEPPYFGIELHSNRVAFILDATETMTTLFTPDPASAQALSRQYVGSDKIGIGKSEIAQALSGLDPRSHFSVIAFGMDIHRFRPNPVQASPSNVTEANAFLDALYGAGRTNYYGALKAALDVGDEPDVSPSFKSTADTITFLTDGLPNEGDIVDADTLVEWYAGLNRYARVKTFTIAFGVVGVDMPLLKGLAERNWGRFTLVREKK